MSLGFLPLLQGQSHTKKSKTPDEIQREYMLTISRQLGVTCNYCHNVDNFKSRNLRAYKVAEEHIKVVQLLNQKGFVGKNAPKADCYMCHRGKAVPDYKEKL